MPSRPEAAGNAVEELVLGAIREHTHLLLGTTISFSDEDWAAPSRLAGWTRSHVAAHLAENARGLLRVVQGLRMDRPVRMYDSESDRARAIERGALADGLSLQIDLDTTAGQLQEEMAALIGDDRAVQLRAGYQIPARKIPVARLYEVVLHTFDLHPDDDDLHASPEVSTTLLEFKAERLGRRADLPALLVESHEGFHARLGSEGPPTVVSGPASDLVAWLARDAISPRLIGAEPLR